MDEDLLAMEAVLSSILLRYYLEGVSLSKAIESNGQISRATFYNWKRDYPELFNRVEAESQVHAKQYHREVAAELTAQRVSTEIQLQGTILDSLEEVVTNVLTVVKNGEDKDKLAAARLISRWAKEGIILTREPDKEQAKPERRALPYDPHAQLDAASITLPQGSRITVETPDAPLEDISSRSGTGP